MEIRKLTEVRLLGVLHRKYLHELLDFCLYEECLQEETAQDYFEWLKAKICDVGHGVPDKRFKKHRDDLFSGSDNEHTATAYGQILRGLGDERFEDRKAHQPSQNGILTDYFQGQTFNEFRKDFKDFVSRDLNNGRITKDESLKILDCFDYYCNLFVKEGAPETRAYSSPNPDFSLEANWQEKNSVRKGKRNLKSGESWEAA
ncbi:MAG: hypothetical protein MJZ50_03810 [Treponema sp.]|nr:hypothetical protein [Treponema sp.]